MFDRYFLLMKVLHVDLFSRRHQFLSIPASAEEARMVSSTCITLALPLLFDNASLVLSVTGSVCKTYFDEVCQSMSQGGGW